MYGSRDRKGRGSDSWVYIEFLSCLEHPAERSGEEASNSTGAVLPVTVS